jgi:hypothetical protein
VRGRKRKPTALHVVGGTYRPDRHGDRLDNQVDAEPLGPCPGYFDHEIAKATWAEVVGLLPAGTATCSDRLMVELAVRLTLQMRMVGGFNAAIAAQLRCTLSELALSSASRARIMTSAVNKLVNGPAEKYFRK